MQVIWAFANQLSGLFFLKWHDCDVLGGHTALLWRRVSQGTLERGQSSNIVKVYCSFLEYFRTCDLAQLLAFDPDQVVKLHLELSRLCLADFTQDLRTQRYTVMISNAHFIN